MNRRVLIAGCGGQLGTELFRVFTLRGYEVTGFNRKELDIA
ncbi:MAG: sugar nucleotide-binding protein, partial [Bryobacterales bacterium]|nr:sugar nucleotide-binding protein [Bryobacterales bacterium]